MSDAHEAVGELLHLVEQLPECPTEIFTGDRQARAIGRGDRLQPLEHTYASPGNFCPASTSSGRTRRTDEVGLASIDEHLGRQRVAEEHHVGERQAIRARTQDRDHVAGAQLTDVQVGRKLVRRRTQRAAQRVGLNVGRQRISHRYDRVRPANDRPHSRGRGVVVHSTVENREALAAGALDVEHAGQVDAGGRREVPTDLDELTSVFTSEQRPEPPTGGLEIESRIARETGHTKAPAKIQGTQRDPGVGLEFSGELEQSSRTLYPGLRIEALRAQVTVQPAQIDGIVPHDTPQELGDLGGIDPELLGTTPPSAFLHPIPRVPG